MVQRRQRTAAPRRARRWCLPLCLLLAVCASSLAVVYATHRSRVLAHELAGLEQAAAQYEMEWHRLLLEQGVWAEQGRVLRLAQKELDMHAPDPHEVVVVKP